jgi:hypothetical protein
MLLAIVSVPLLLSQASYAEDVTFVIPGSKDPNLRQFFDPEPLYSSILMQNRIIL